MELLKFIVGIRPSSKIFRLSSLEGMIIDSILSLRGKKPIEAEYYSEVATNIEQGAFRLQNNELGNIIRVDQSNIIFIKDSYETGNVINTEKVLGEFYEIWSAINKVLKLNDVRRIGIAAEFRISSDVNNINIKALEVFSKISPPKHPGKFHLRYEDRREAKTGKIPDIEKSDFVNVIYDYYDSEMDVDHPKPGLLNTNIDVQRYFSPLLTKNIWEEVKIQKRKFDNEIKDFRANLKRIEMV